MPRLRPLLAALLAVAPAISSQAEVTPGEILMAEMNCMACHQATPEIAQRLASRTSPELGNLRLTPAWMRDFLADPQKTKPGTLMPDMLHKVPAEKKSAVVEELVHFLVKNQQSVPSASIGASEAKIETGKALYHSVGCVQCHAPFEPPKGMTLDDVAKLGISKLQSQSVPLAGPHIAQKYTVGELATFLRDPLKIRPAGRMPSLKLDATEAESIAMYLLRDQLPAGKPMALDRQPMVPTAYDASFVVDETKAANGALDFTTFQCASCHAGPKGSVPAVAIPTATKPLDRLRPRQPIGCLAPNPPQRAAKFELTDRQRTVIIAGLQNQAVLTEPLTPDQQIKRTMTTLNCYACHQRDRRGGIIGMRRDYLTSLGEVNLGDEGRVPPHLTGVGEKLKTAKIRKVPRGRRQRSPFHGHAHAAIWQSKCRSSPRCVRACRRQAGRQRIVSLKHRALPPLLHVHDYPKAPRVSADVGAPCRRVRSSRLAQDQQQPRGHEVPRLCTVENNG
jgi:cytochrome c551/c552